ncbi:MAG: hypothetical protein AMJ81_12945 [Phycisphaerae bacterium SM23_33]|jgi:hypothetical protein|nr:MAG: hypothetical protein AMJ81_12945 [Phycisphaerae bacterium SM23_33]
MLANRICRLVCPLVILVATGAVWAADQPPAQPQQSKAQPQPLKVTVREVTGVAQRLVAGEKPTWVALKAGDQLDETAVIRTGFGTRVVLAFADNSEVVVDRATKMGIAEFRKEGPVTKTRLGLKYGSLRASVEKARGPNDFRVATAAAVLAVTGTSGQVGFTGDFGFGLTGRTGTWAAQAGARQRRVSGTETVDSTLQRHVETLKRNLTPRLGDVYGGLTESEESSLRRHGGGRGAIGFVAAGSNTASVLRSADQSFVSARLVPTNP